MVPIDPVLSLSLINEKSSSYFMIIHAWNRVYVFWYKRHGNNVTHNIQNKNFFRMKVSNPNFSVSVKIRIHEDISQTVDLCRQIQVGHQFIPLDFFYLIHHNIVHFIIPADFKQCLLINWITFLLSADTYRYLNVWVRTDQWSGLTSKLHNCTYKRK